MAEHDYGPQALAIVTALRNREGATAMSVWGGLSAESVV